jgi:hypothetical protein
VTTTDRENEMELQALLRQRAAGVEVSGDFAPVAVARRRRDQRARVLVAAAAVAAVAVGVPVLWSTTRGSTPPVPALPTATASLPSPTGSVPTTAPTTTATSPTDLPSTTAPTAPPSSLATRADAYALDDTIRFGTTVLHLEKGTVVESLAVLANGGFVLQSHLSTGASQSEMELLSPAGRTVRALGASGMYAVSPDGTRVLAKDGTGNTLVVYAPDGTVVGQRRDTREVGAIVAGTAYLNGGPSEGSLAWDFTTGATRGLPAHLVAVSPDGTRAALGWMVTTDAQDEACWAVVDLRRPTAPTIIQKCGPGENPTLFMPTAFSSRGTYLVGSDYVDGGFWFSAGVVRVSDGTVVLGGTGDAVVSGWTWHLDDDESTFVISRNTSKPVSPATRNALQHCSLALACTDVQPEVTLQGRGGFTEPRYVVPR